MKIITRRQRAHLKFLMRRTLGRERKIFIIGRNKTGTTSLTRCLEQLGFYIGDQKRAETFIDDYRRGDFLGILGYCESAEVFQDVPFSWPETYKHVFSRYPDAKYILLERESSESWYDSLVGHHQRLVMTEQAPSAEDLKRFNYRRAGYLWEAQQVVYEVDENTLYDKQIYIRNYEKYNREVKEFFRGNENFLCLILSEKSAEAKLANFLGMDIDLVKIPHLNKSV